MTRLALLCALVLASGAARTSENDAPGTDVQLILGNVARTTTDAKVNVALHNGTKSMVSLAEVECAALDKDSKPSEVNTQDVENIAADQTAYAAVPFKNAISGDYHYVCRLAFVEHKGV